MATVAHEEIKKHGHLRSPKPIGAANGLARCIVQPLAIDAPHERALSAVKPISVDAAQLRGRDVSTTKRAKWFQAGHSSNERGLQQEVSRFTAIRQLFIRRSQGEDETCFDVIEDRDLRLRSQALKAMVVLLLEMWALVH